MPSIIPSYLYSVFAALLVGAILVYACSASTINMKNEAIYQQLTNVNEYVATQSLMLISQTTENSQNTSQIIDIPPQIGNQPFWIRLQNDTSGTWVESGFGSNSVDNGRRVYVPAVVAALGSYESGSGRAMLSCYFDENTLKLVLTQV